MKRDKKIILSPFTFFLKCIINKIITKKGDENELISIEYVGGEYSISADANGTREIIGEKLSPKEAINAIKAFE